MRPLKELTQTAIDIGMVDACRTAAGKVLSSLPVNSADPVDGRDVSQGRKCSGHILNLNRLHMLDTEFIDAGADLSCERTSKKIYIMMLLYIIL